MLDARKPWEPHLGPERVVEGIHYGWLMKDHFARYRMAAEYCRDKTVLDIATGTGYGANMLRNAGARLVVAVDCNQDALAYARGRYGTEGLRWVALDGHRLPLGERFDAITCFETVEHMTDPDLFLSELYRVLRPGGVLLISTPLNTGREHISPCHEKEYSLAEFRCLLEKHFPSVQLLGQRRALQEAIRLLGGFPDRYATRAAEGRPVNTRIYRLLSMVNKAPNALIAWALGMGEGYREAIRPIDQAGRRSRFLDEHFFIMIGVCRKT
jgi:ubiquinone/menaquinone biosynthesis C-methylase UbiE